MPIARLGPDFIVNTTAASNQFEPGPDAAAMGGNAMTWDPHDSDDSSSGGVRARPFDAAGGVVQAIVGGTSGADFIHRSGDGLVPPPGFNELTGVTTGADNITGGDGADIIYGDGGNDLITGGLGADQLHGGQGDDRFYLDSLGEISGLVEFIDGDGGQNVIEYRGAGGTLDLSQSVISNVTRLTLAPSSGELNVLMTAEQLSGFTDMLLANESPVRITLSTPGSVSLSGVSILSIDQISGSSGNDFLQFEGAVYDLTVSGGDGNDTITVIGTGNDSKSTATSLDGGGGNDVLKSATGLNTLLGGEGKDKITGGKQNDTLHGGAGADKLNGGGKQDTLTGGEGRDTFILSTGKDSGPYANSRDTITDFSQAQGDRIDLSAMDADTTVDGIQDYHLGGAAFTNTPGELIQFVDGEGRTILAGDSSGDGFAEFEIVLLGGPVLVISDFIL